MSVLTVKVIRIDPVNHAVVMKTIEGKKLNREIVRICKARQIGHQELLKLEDYRIMGRRVDGTSFDFGPTPLHAAADAEQDKGQPGWKLKGSDIVTVGLSVLFSSGESGGISSIPIDLSWIADNLVWMTAEEVDADAAAKGEGPE